jgi:hypothetical protein
MQHIPTTGSLLIQSLEEHQTMSSLHIYHKVIISITVTLSILRSSSIVGITDMC